MNELYKKHRPKELKELVGQTAAVASLVKMIERDNLPHVLLFTGPSGTGKTTLARILRDHLDCGKEDFIEMNCADFKGIDMVRDVRRHCTLRPMHGKVRVWYIDEAHKLTGDAQNAFLKLLEDTPEHVYFMLSTTDPQKLIKAILTRCTEIKLSAISDAELNKLLVRVIKREQLGVTEDVVTEIVSVSEGSARKALVILDQVGHLESEEEQLTAISTTTVNKDQAIELARALFKKGVAWGEVGKLLKDMKDDPESIRYLVLGYARSVLLNSGSAHAFKVIDIFSKNFYDSKQAGLAAACWEVLNG